MKNKYLLTIFALIFLNSCIGTSSTGVFGTGVTIAMDPRTLGTQIDDSIMDKTLDAKLLSTNKNYILNVRTKIIDGRIFITCKVDTIEEKLNITATNFILIFFSVGMKPIQVFLESLLSPVLKIILIL